MKLEFSGGSTTHGLGGGGPVHYVVTEIEYGLIDVLEIFGYMQFGAVSKVYCIDIFSKMILTCLS